jgi:hypothetical protein
MITLQVVGVPAQGATPSLFANQAQEAQETTYRWVQDNYHTVVDLALKTSCDSAMGSRAAHWATCVQIIPGHREELEYVLSLEQHYDGTIVASITRSKGQSVYTQLSELREKHPGASSGELAKSVMLETRTVTEQEFPGLRRLASDFQKIQVSPVADTGLAMDATEYGFHSRTDWGNRMEIVLSGPGSSARRQPLPLLEWVESFRGQMVGFFKDASPLTTPR